MAWPLPRASDQRHAHRKTIATHLFGVADTLFDLKKPPTVFDLLADLRHTPTAFRQKDGHVRCALQAKTTTAMNIAPSPRNVRITVV